MMPNNIYATLISCKFLINALHKAYNLAALFPSTVLRNDTKKGRSNSHCSICNPQPFTLWLRLRLWTRPPLDKYMIFPGDYEYVFLLNQSGDNTVVKIK